MKGLEESHVLVRPDDMLPLYINITKSILILILIIEELRIAINKQDLTIHSQGQW